MVGVRDDCVLHCYSLSTGTAEQVRLTLPPQRYMYNSKSVETLRCFALPCLDL